VYVLLTFDEPSRRKWPKLFTNFFSRFSLTIFDLYIFFFVSVLPGPSEELRSFAPEHDLPDASDTALQLEDERSQGGQPLDRRV